MRRPAAHQNRDAAYRLHRTEFSSAILFIEEPLLVFIHLAESYHRQTKTPRDRAFLLVWREGLVSAATVASLATTVTAAVHHHRNAFAARRAFTLRASERNGERAAVHLLTIQRSIRRLSLRFGSHLDEAESA